MSQNSSLNGQKASDFVNQVHRFGRLTVLMALVSFVGLPLLDFLCCWP